jgi:quinol monooxygenase YgiN
MFIVQVQVKVKPEYLAEFIAITQDNAENSVQEAGIARFDVIQNLEDPTEFVLVEVYRTPEDPARHKETAHYARWRDTVAPMMAAPRQATRYANIFPADAGW